MNIKPQHIGIAIGLITIIGSTAFIIWQVRKTQAAAKDDALPENVTVPTQQVGGVTVNTTTVPVPKPAVVPKPAPVSTFPLARGSRGPEVKNLQGYLNRKYPVGLTLLDEDGVFGSKTEAFLKKFVGTTSVSRVEYDAMMAKATSSMGYVYGKGWGITAGRQAGGAASFLA